MNKFAVFIIIAISVLIRLFPHLPNFAPIGAMALFGGTYLNRKYSVSIVLLTMLISDYLLLYINPYNPQWVNFSRVYSPLYLFHSTILYVYGAFALTGLIGIWLRSHKNIVNVFGATLASSVLFFLITNFGVWAQGMYARDISGLFQSYVMAIPFFKNTLLGNFFYVSLFFGSYEFVKALSNKKFMALLKSKK